MILALVAVALGLPILWAVSIGALRDLEQARKRDPRAGCQTWVAVAGLPRRRYRCAEPVLAGSSRCRRHEVGLARGTADDTDVEERDDVEYRDEPQTVGRALAQARIGIPLALLAVASAAGGLGWLLQRAL